MLLCPAYSSLPRLPIIIVAVVNVNIMMIIVIIIIIVVIVVKEKAVTSTWICRGKPRLAELERDLPGP